MGLLWRRDKPVVPAARDRPAVCVSAQDEIREDMKAGLTYDNSNVTRGGIAPWFDFYGILMNKQERIYDLYALADYFVDADPIFRGIIKGVYTPFSVSEWRLKGANDRVKEKYEEYYERIHLRDKMWSIFYQYYKYGQVFVYLRDNGDLITLPPHRCRIGYIMIDGEPVVEFNALQVAIDLGFRKGSVLREWVQDQDIRVRLTGYPPEITAALERGDEWAQLNPERTFVLQDIKEDWLRYAVPMIASALLALKKKAAISNYEDSTINMMVHSFLHVKYGDDSKNADFLPNANELSALNSLFKAAMGKNGTGIATTNVFADAKFIQPDINDLFDNDLYSDVNNEILSAGGISGIIVNGLAEDGSSFASAQVSMQTAALRIKQARDNFCELMNKINLRLNGDILPQSNRKNIPEFTFPPVDLAGTGKLYETCLKLWQEGVLSTKTMMDIHGYDMDQEAERRRHENSEGITNTLRPRGETDSTQESGGDGDGTPGRPRMDDNERQSDPADSMTGRQPKPSSPEGSL